MTLIIAEAGVNHNGDMVLAKRLVDIAKNAGADFIKFQTFKAVKLVTVSAEKATYQKSSSLDEESQFEMIRRLELNLAEHEELIKYCEKNGIGFLSSPFDEESIELLAELNTPLYKIPSGEITNLPYLRHVGRMGKPVVMSTGMSTLDEVRSAMKILMAAGCRKEDLIILHCNSEYPTPMDDVNLRAMLTIRDELNVKVGYSDHTVGIEVAIAAVAMGASVIEKHFTLERTLPGPDHAASLEPNELTAMVSAIRNIERAMGNTVKRPSPSEEKNLSVVRKSIVACKPIKKGDYFSEENLAVKRPGTGISPMDWDRIIGKQAVRDFQIDDAII
ncbi:MAG: N-acetylneuraminate synthase [Deltaproteobacteria bacterium]|nr:N-acetylneuraminate synthase [Deltaproteobacteria bacterium]